MEATTAKTGTRKDVQTIINDKIIEQLEKRIVPWCKPWTAGIPINLITRKPYRNINLLLLSCLGYDKNIFIRENQMKTVGASILPGERAHMVAFWNYKDEAGKDQAPQLRYYFVYNVAQCSGISEDLLNVAANDPFDFEACQRIVSDMPHRPELRSKESMAFYDVLEDCINMPKEKAFRSKEEHYSALMHQLVHSTGHHTRLDRMGVVQMTEYGYTGCSQEEIVAGTGTRYLEALTGISSSAPQTDEYIKSCICKLQSDKTLIFTSASLAQKAIDFILDLKADSTEVVEEIAGA